MLLFASLRSYPASVFFAIVQHPDISLFVSVQWWQECRVVLLLQLVINFFFLFVAGKWRHLSRLVTFEDAARPEGNRGKGKGKVYRRTSHERPQGEKRYNVTVSLTWTLGGGG